MRLHFWLMAMVFGVEIWRRAACCRRRRVVSGAWWHIYYEYECQGTGCRSCQSLHLVFRRKAARARKGPDTRIDGGRLQFEEARRLALIAMVNVIWRRAA